MIYPQTKNFWIYTSPHPFFWEGGGLSGFLLKEPLLKSIFFKCINIFSGEHLPSPNVGGKIWGILLGKQSLFKHFMKK